MNHAPPAKPRAAHSVAAKAAAAAGVAVVVVAGIWVSGGLITNDFGLAMWLTAGWMGVAGLAALGAALRWRDLAVPVVGAYLLVAAVTGVYLGRSTLLDDVVDEDVVTAAEPARGAQRDHPAAESARPRPSNVLLARGRFQPLAHSVTGVASAIRRASGGRVLTLTRFEVDNGPDLRVYLVAGPARSEGEVDEFEDLGGLKGNKGDQQYALPDGLDLDRYSTVVIWCRAFSVAFARAPLRTSGRTARVVPR
jgi:hypothetical protein